MIDFGATTLAGDRRIDPLSSAVYLTAPAITPTTAPGDAKVAQKLAPRPSEAQIVSEGIKQNLAADMVVEQNPDIEILQVL